MREGHYTHATVLVTGGAGYIGSHTCIQLIEEGFEVIVVDSLINSSKESIRRVFEITGKNVLFFQGDLRDERFLETVFSSQKIHLVIHIAGLKAVGESVSMSLKYYDNNVGGTISLLKVMEKYNVKQIVFSSSATVYGNPHTVPIKETFTLQPTNPYGRSKLQIETILQDLHTSQPEWKIIILRYFNPVGAHPSGRLGEDPAGKPNNLFPFITQVAIGKIPQLTIFGSDYNTHDGTGIRDYLHITDLAKGHVAAIQNLQKSGPRFDIYNLGSGRGYSVKEVVSAMQKTIGREIPYKISQRRAGDVDILLADTQKARKELGWDVTHTLDEMCRDVWRWQSQNPNGYSKSLL